MIRPTVAEIQAAFCLVGNAVVRLSDGKPVDALITVRFKGCVLAPSHVAWVVYYGEWPPKEFLVDHKNRNRRDNSKENLRLATYSQNGFNMASRNPNGYKGITYQLDRPTKPWLAQIRIDGRKVNLGRYETKEEAAEIYREIALQYHGEFACLE